MNAGQPMGAVGMPQQQQAQQQPQQQTQQQQAQQGGGTADYSAQWAEYYRSIGKIAEAEAIEKQMKVCCIRFEKYSAALSVLNTNNFPYSKDRMARQMQQAALLTVIMHQVSIAMLVAVVTPAPVIIPLMAATTQRCKV